MLEQICPCNILMVKLTPLPKLPNTRECNRTGNHVKTQKHKSTKNKISSCCWCGASWHCCLTWCFTTPCHSMIPWDMTPASVLWLECIESSILITAAWHRLFQQRSWMMSTTTLTLRRLLGSNNILLVWSTTFLTRRTGSVWSALAQVSCSCLVRYLFAWSCFDWGTSPKWLWPSHGDGIFHSEI